MTSNPKDEGLKDCPYCGAQVPEKAIYCSACKMNLLAEFTSLKREMADPPPVGGTLAAAAALLLLLFLIGMALLDVNQWFPYAGIIFLGVITLLLGIVSARGRYGNPGFWQYLLSFFIVLIPVIGTLYGIYYAARSMARVKGTRFALYFLLLGMALVAFLYYSDFQGIVTGQAVAAQDTPVATEAPEATATQRPKPTSTKKVQPTAEATEPAEEPEEIEGAPRVVSDCTHWSDVTSDMVGVQSCVYGEYLDIFQKQDDVYVMSFSEEPGTFQIWSWPKPVEMYIPDEGSRCVVVRNLMKTSGIRPIMILRTSSTLDSCME